jgi:hypothetical protein
MAKEGIQVPLSFELGWHGRGKEEAPAMPAEQEPRAQTALR